jgi:hypothetical protein
MSRAGDQPSSGPQPLLLAGGPVAFPGRPLRAAVRPFLADPSLAGARSVTIAAASGSLARDGNGPVHRLVTLLLAPDRAVHVIAPRSFAASLVHRRASHSVSVPLPAATSRLEEIAVPASLLASDALILVNRLHTESSRGSPVLGAWPRFLAPLPRLASRASNPRDGLAAEIALAFHPALILVTARHAGMALAAATSDQVAAELVALALRALDQSVPDPETSIGPWENPLVQRATELGLGASLPSDIALEQIWTGPTDQLSGFAAVAARIRLALALPPAP